MSDLITAGIGSGLGSILFAFPKRIVNVKLDPASPWVSVDVEPAWGEEATPTNAERKFAVWKATQRVYVVDEHGAAADEPIMSIEKLKEAPDAARS